MLKVVSAQVAHLPTAAELIRKISETAHLTQENLHDIVWSVHARNSSMESILARMQEFMYSIFEGQDVELLFRADDQVAQADLPLENRYHLYLIFKEWINNGAKYARATRVSIHLHQVNNDIEMVYRDNGVGFDVEQTAQGGNGLDNMRTRAEAMGGSLQVVAAPGKGVLLRLLFPLKS
jgi:signal transduction histidine kinase